jgi:hypothetical protein
MVGSVGSSASAYSVTTASYKSTTASPAAGSAGGCKACGDSADISGPGKLFSDLKELASQDPAKLKGVLSDIAGKLKAASAGGGPDSFLSKLASAFDAASQTGDLSGLEPPKPPTSGAGTYGASGQAGPPFVQGSGGLDLKALFENIQDTVTDALGGTAA